MLLIFGTRVFETLIVLVTMVCSNCHVEAEQRVLQLDHKLTFFFIPLFRVSTRYAVVCSNCGVATALSKDEVDSAVAWKSRNGKPNP